MKYNDMILIKIKFTLKELHVFYITFSLQIVSP